MVAYGSLNFGRRNGLKRHRFKAFTVIKVIKMTDNMTQILLSSRCRKVEANLNYCVGDKDQVCRRMYRRVKYEYPENECDKNNTG
jgi:hypothetical protein